MTIDVKDYVICSKEVLAYGYVNSAITGKPQSLMMVKLDNVGDQYPEFAIPLHSAAPTTGLKIITEEAYDALVKDAKEKSCQE